jgi:hypothetical protein
MMEEQADADQDVVDLSFRAKRGILVFVGEKKNQDPSLRSG